MRSCFSEVQEVGGRSHRGRTVSMSYHVALELAHSGVWWVWCGGCGDKIPEAGCCFYSGSLWSTFLKCQSAILISAEFVGILSKLCSCCVVKMCFLG